MSCSHIGVSGDKIRWMRSKDGKLFWCRQPIAIMGSYNTSEKYIRDTSPFEKGYKENFVEGKGKTKEEALLNMNKSVKDISDSLFSI